MSPDGIVSLKGTVDSEQEKAKAVRLARVATITTVDNQLEVGSTGVKAAVSDTAITTQIKGQLVANTALRKGDISVTTNNGVVTLSGTVPPRIYAGWRARSRETPAASPGSKTGSRSWEAADALKPEAHACRWRSRAGAPGCSSSQRRMSRRRSTPTSCPSPATTGSCSMSRADSLSRAAAAFSSGARGHQRLGRGHDVAHPCLRPRVAGQAAHIGQRDDAGQLAALDHRKGALVGRHQISIHQLRDASGRDPPRSGVVASDARREHPPADRARAPACSWPRRRCAGTSR